MRKVWPFVLAIPLASCDDFNPRWKGWVYPDANFLSDDIPIGRFSSLEECRAASRAILQVTAERQYPNGGEIIGDYECGYDCEADESIGGLNVCQKTEK